MVVYALQLHDSWWFMHYSCMIHGGLCTTVLVIHGCCFYHIGMVPAHMSTPMPYNTSLHQVTVGPVPGGLQEVIYSGKHNGIYIYLARILR